MGGERASKSKKGKKACLKKKEKDLQHKKAFAKVRGTPGVQFAYAERRRDNSS